MLHWLFGVKVGNDLLLTLNRLTDYSQLIWDSGLTPVGIQPIKATVRGRWNHSALSEVLVEQPTRCGLGCRCLLSLACY
ncbi:hypothetical protein XM38_006340 [Halomicronema hongdechloris C2206]|uniref:Uncharacterized protein n=1 Tax=Halomicronema hongdechloris C2206 TaxID=1641165 RepID=A0A1Z3HHE8_9CYAN|nr:hypothetical protein XM38_006340 [Halomicronema hongdechloris C2206]